MTWQDVFDDYTLDKLTDEQWFDLFLCFCDDLGLDPDDAPESFESDFSVVVTEFLDAMDVFDRKLKVMEFWERLGLVD